MLPLHARFLSVPTQNMPAMLELKISHDLPPLLVLPPPSDDNFGPSDQIGGPTIIERLFLRPYDLAPAPPTAQNAISALHDLRNHKLWPPRYSFGSSDRSMTPTTSKNAIVSPYDLQNRNFWP